MKYNIFIFRRDLRVIDNNGLNYAMINLRNIIPIFIFTPEQLTDSNKYKSDNAIQFMCESIKELSSKLKKKSLKLYLFYGENIEILDKICKVIEVENIIFNMDYTNYALERDRKIEDYCLMNNINMIKKEDYLLKSMGSFLKSDGSLYEIFTPFKNNAMKKDINIPIRETIKNLKTADDLDSISLKRMISYKKNKDILVKGGRKNGLEILKNIDKFKDYDETRNYAFKDSTTHLSAYIKFGNLSIREVYWRIREILGMDNGLITQLYWREFYYYVGYYNQDILRGKNYRTKYDKMNWNYDEIRYLKWCSGNTGFPIVDAGMRELNKTGYMHNRLRMITSNFLNRMLGFDWRKGEIYFANNLTDYDPYVNNGNHQWIASTGVDPKPYFQRLFNPWLQSKKIDKDCIYIKKWIPELRNIECKHLHEWDKFCKEYDLDKIGYFEPMVEYKIARKESVEMYRNI